MMGVAGASLALKSLSFVFLTGAISAAAANGLECGAESDCLRPGSSESVGLLPEPLKQLELNVSSYSKPANYGSYTHNEVHPIQPGAVVVVGHQRTVVSSFALKQAVLYADANGTKIPSDERIATTQDTIYDMASLTKLFTTIAALRQLDNGSLSLSEPVASYIPEFAQNGKESITIQMLLTHTSGFDADPNPPLYAPVYKTVEQRRNAIIAEALIDEPGTTYKYSDLNLMTLGLVLEAVTGKALDSLVSDFTVPLGMKDTFFNRGNIEGPAFKYHPRMAAQEFQIEVVGPSVPQRPQPVRGTVHDENAWALDGVSGHAGLFSTAKDTAIFCQMILNNGTYGGVEILRPETVDLIFRDFNTQFPGNAHGLGFELNQRTWSGPMASPLTAGHTGFTGVSLAIDRPSNTFFILFANRVHPSRLWSSNNIVRQALGYWVARALGRDVSFPT